jgi:hypothetical protein
MGSGCAPARRAGCAPATWTHARDLLIVRGGKLGKSPLVRHGPRIGELLARSSSAAPAGAELHDEAPFFGFDDSRSVHPCSASQTSYRLAGELRLEVPAGIAFQAAQPAPLVRIRLPVALVQQGLDPAARLHQLSTFMGHVDPSSTAVC